MSNIIDSIQLSGTVYTLSAQTSGGGNPTIELTQAQYDALVTAGTVQADTYYIITDAQAGDLTNYYTKSETNTLLGGKADTATTYTKTEVDTALAGKQTTLTAGTGIDITDNVISATGGGGGGKAIEAGTNISVTTGETADTINCTLPISFGLRNTSLSFFGSNNANNDYTCAFGYGNNVLFAHSYAFGIYNENRGNYTLSFGRNNKIQQNSNDSVAFGFNNRTSNYNEFVSGKFNVSNTGSTDADKTLFSVGNGTADNARHNAFEIRQNGDIYLTKDGQDVKLQDQLGGSSITVDTALDSGSTNPVENRVIYNKIDEVEQVTAAGLNAVNDKFGGLKLQQITQSDYNNLQTKDPSTLYIIVN